MNKLCTTVVRSPAERSLKSLQYSLVPAEISLRLTMTSGGGDFCKRLGYRKSRVKCSRISLGGLTYLRNL